MTTDTTNNETRTKNGYEIRTDILALAKSSVEFTYEQQLAQWKWNNSDDKSTMPQVPTLDDVIKTADAMYKFVNNNSSRISTFTTRR